MALRRNDQYLPALTGARAVAAYLVFIHHFNPFSAGTFGISLHNFFDEMHIGVSLFFVLSGLLICLRYYESFTHDAVSFYNYMVKRVAKIYPVYFLILTLNFIYYRSTGFFDTAPYPGWVYYIGGITFIKGFFAGLATTFVGQAWSLTVEECFYFLAPFFFLLIRRNKTALFNLPLLLIGFGCMLVAIFGKYPFHGFFGDVRFLFNFTFFGRCIEFFVGIGLAIIYKSSTAENRRTKGWFTYAGILGIILCVWGISLFHTTTDYGDKHPVGIVINNLLLPIFGIGVFYWGLLTERTLVSRILSTPLFDLLGKSSYVFYLVHVGVFASLLYQFVTHNVIILFICLNIVSVILYRLYEHPLNVWIKKQFLLKARGPISQTV